MTKGWFGLFARAVKCLTHTQHSITRVSESVRNHCFIKFLAMCVRRVTPNSGQGACVVEVVQREPWDFGG